MEFRDAIKYLRSELGLTQVDLARGLNINAITIGRWENGKTLPTRSITAVLLEFARLKGASEVCLSILLQAINSAAKDRLDSSCDKLYAVEHASLRQLIDDASFPIYVSDIETDELLYLNQKAIDMLEDDGSAIGKKCYEMLMHRSTPCEFCMKDTLVYGTFKSYDICRSDDGTPFHVQGKLIQWNSRRAQVRYVFARELAQKDDADESSPDSLIEEKEENKRLIMQSNEAARTTAQLITIFENINGGVSVVAFGDNDRVSIAYANNRYYELFGYTKQQFLSECKTTHENLHPDDAEYALENITRVRETLQPVSFRYRIVKRDKSIAYIRCSTSITAIDGLGDKVMISFLTDITESVQAEQQANVLGQRLDTIMSNISCAVTAAVFNDDSSIEYLFSNELFHGMLGYTADQYKKEVVDPFQLVHPDDAPSVYGSINAMSRIGDTCELQYRIISRNGTIKWLRARISVVTFQDTEKPVQFSVYTDVTDIVRATEMLSAQHQQTIDILNETPSGIAVVEVDMNDVAGSLHTVYYNDRFYSYSGYDRDEYDTLLKINEMYFVFDEDIPNLLEKSEKICRGKIGDSLDITVRCHTKDGGFRWLLLTGQLVQRCADICTVNISLIDITARKEAIERQRISEEMFRIAAETDNRAMIVYEVKNNRCRVESRMLYSGRYGEVFDNVPQSLIDRGIAAAESSVVLKSLFERIRNGEKRITVSLLVCTGKDKYEWYECNTATVFDVAGNPDQAVLVFHNITEQRIKEAVYKKWQQSIATRSPESYTLFRCNLSDDNSLDEQEGKLLKISYPSDIISFNTRTKLYAEEYVCPEDRDAYIKFLDSDTLLGMFYRGEKSTFIEYREIKENNKQVWRRLTVEMVEYLSSTDVQAFLMYEDIDEKKKAEIAAKQILESDPLTGALNRAAFAERVDAVLRKAPAIQNALIMFDMDGFKQLNDSFGHAAGDQALQDVTAVLRAYSRNDDFVCRLGGDEFLVWLYDIPYDAVIGKIVQQMCKHICKAYSQQVLLSASAGIAVYPRDGQSYEELYLSADKALYKVKQTQKGSFAFFSRIEEDETPEIRAALSKVAQNPRYVRYSKRRLLVVDDNEISRVMLKNMFEDEYIIETAKNGSEAMIRLHHFGVAISAVLLDLVMPEVDGFSVLKKMQSDMDLCTIPVVVVTGDEEHSTILKAIELGASEYVTKPVDIDIIRMRVQSVISKAESERLRAQNSYLMLQRNEELKYRIVLESTGTVVVEYDCRNQVFSYDDEISKYIAGNFDHRSLWQVLQNDNAADSSDVKLMQDVFDELAGNSGVHQQSKLIMLKTPTGEKHWFRMNIYKNNENSLPDKMIITFNDVHEDVLANEKLLFQATRDELTGIYNRAGFIERATQLIEEKNPGYYVMACIDIEKFKVINDQYGSDKGDEILRGFAEVLTRLHHGENGICCRVMADNFAILYPAELIGSPELAKSHHDAAYIDETIPTIQFAVGRCIVDDKSLDVSAIYDRATIAKNTVKGRYDTHIATFDESMRTEILRQQEITAQMNLALKSGQFEIWLQPQFNHSNGMLSGAEALVRWRHPTEGIISPVEFIPIFERNGFVYEVDKYIWEQTCVYLRKWLDAGLNPVPVSVNISRYDLFRSDFISIIEGLVRKYKLPINMLRLEVTESAFTESTEQIIRVVEELVKIGFTVEIDDFGSGYSSLNTLKDVPAQILKMDMRFLENDRNAQRGGSIIEAVVRMAKWLGMSVIAEGVETIEQADYLTSIGCNYIQGFLYSRPTTVAEYEEVFSTGEVEASVDEQKIVETWNNNAFWNPASMETLIFNSYIGGACIFEFINGKTELLRYNKEYTEIFASTFGHYNEISRNDILSVLDEDNSQLLRRCITSAIMTKRESSCEVKLISDNNEDIMFLRTTIRLIAQAGERYLFYCVVFEITEQRIAEMKAIEYSELINAVMGNSHYGISAVIAHADGTVDYKFTNSQFYKLLGYTEQQYKTEVNSPFECVYHEDRERVFNIVTKLTKSGDNISLRIRVLRRDSSIIWLHCDISTASFINISEPVQICSFLDITEQVENEDKLLENNGS